jgi:hypothetical protein
MDLTRASEEPGVVPVEAHYPRGQELIIELHDPAIELLRLHHEVYLTLGYKGDGRTRDLVMDPIHDVVDQSGLDYHDLLIVVPVRSVG